MYQRENNEPIFFNPDVGGLKKMDEKSIKNQINVLNKKKEKDMDNSLYEKPKVALYNTIQKQHVGKEIDETMGKKIYGSDAMNKYNPIIEWAKKYGLTTDNSARYNVHYLHIDSSQRDIESTISINEYFSLGQNPFLSTEYTDIIYITHPNHPFQVEDKITVDGLVPITTQMVYTSGDTKPFLEFLNDGTGKIGYIKVNYPHGIPETYKTDTGDLFCDIDGLKNPDAMAGYEGYYGNILLTFINGRHNIFLEDSTHGLLYNANYFYILLPNIFLGVPGTISPTTKQFVTLKLYYANGIPTNQINANFPINIYHSSSYQIINEIQENGYSIKVNTIAKASGQFGGNNIRIGRVSDYAGGYTEPNQYTIKLSRIYKNVVYANLVSTIFPRSEYAIKNYPQSTINNKIYWQNYEEGDYTYSANILVGTYSNTTLARILEATVYNVMKVTHPTIETFFNHNYTTTPNNVMKFMIDLDSDTTTIKSYKERIITRPFAKVYYINSSQNFTELPTASTSDPAEGYLYPLFVLVIMYGHRLTLNTMYKSNPTPSPYVSNGTKGDTIRIDGAIDFYGISSTYLNGEFEAYEINDVMTSISNADDAFMIKLQPFDIGTSATRSTKLGGGIFKIYTPNVFRLMFDKVDTIGTVLGFQNAGSPLSVTKYSNTITNKDTYEPDLNPVINLDETTPGNAIDLEGYNYINMVCPQLPVIDATGSIKTLFAKIELNNKYGRMNYDTFVATPLVYYNPIKELSELSVSYYSPSGELYDFNGLNHSFIIELITLDELPKESNFNEHAGVTL